MKILSISQIIPRTRMIPGPLGSLLSPCHIVEPKRDLIIDKPAIGGMSTLVENGIPPTVVDSALQIHLRALRCFRLAHFCQGHVIRDCHNYRSRFAEILEHSLKLFLRLPCPTPVSHNFQSHFGNSPSCSLG